VNIFATDPNPAISAIALDDKRLVKMVLETAQILSTAYPGITTYKPTHSNHPCVAWANADITNARWLIEHGFALAYEYSRRFCREHASRMPLLQLDLRLGQAAKQPTAFQNCARNAALNLDFTTISDTHAAYRAYLNARWALAAAAGKPPRWTNATAPRFQ
jgi:hypothetical protein